MPAWQRQWNDVCQRMGVQPRQFAILLAVLALLLLSPPIPRVLSCTIMSMEYPDFGQRTSSSTDSPNRRRVSLTCCWVADGAAFAHTNASRHVSFKAHMSLTASIRSLGSTLQPTKN